MKTKSQTCRLQFGLMAVHTKVGVTNCTCRYIATDKSIQYLHNLYLYINDLDVGMLEQEANKNCLKDISGAKRNNSRQWHGF